MKPQRSVSYDWQSSQLWHGLAARAKGRGEEMYGRRGPPRGNKGGRKRTNILGCGPAVLLRHVFTPSTVLQHVLQ